MISQSRVAALLCAFMKWSSTFSRVQLDCRAFRLTALPSTELKKKLLMLLLMKICGHRRAGQQPARAGARATLLLLLLAHHRVGDRAVNAVERVRAAQFLLRLARGGYGLVVEVRPQPDQPVQPVHRLAQRQLRRALPRRGSGTAEVAERAHGIPELLLVLLRVEAGADRRAQPVHPERARSCAAGPAAQSGARPCMATPRQETQRLFAVGCGLWRGSCVARAAAPRGRRH